MNLPTEKAKRFVRHKMFEQDSFKVVWLVGLISFTSSRKCGVINRMTAQHLPEILYSLAVVMTDWL